MQCEEGVMKKVLLASSSTTFLSRNVDLFIGKGFEFITALSGSEAISLHKRHTFDLVLSELELADMDGRTLCSELRNSEKSKALPFVIICQDSPAQIDKVRESEASALLVRPINPTHLLVTVGSFIGMQLARSKRVAFSSEVAVKTPDVEFVAKSHDISVTGILIETDKQLLAGDEISCRLNLYGTAGVTEQCEIVRCVNSGSARKLYGVKFKQLSMVSRNMIGRYISSNSHLGISQNPHIPGSSLHL